MTEPIGRGVLDPPHARGMTTAYRVAISASLAGNDGRLAQDDSPFKSEQFATNRSCE